MMRKIANPTASRRARLSINEIALATALTLAAITFIVAALRDRGPETAAIVQQPAGGTPPQSGETVPN